MISASKLHQVSREVTAELGFVENYEQEQLAHFCRVVSEARRFIDVGANRGLYANVANRVMDGGYIALVEANPGLAEELRRAISLWPRTNGNTVEVFAVAAGDVVATVPFFTDATDTLGSCVRESWEVRPDSCIEVRSQPLDDLFKPQDGTVIKIDVEGFEYRVLRGAARLILSGRPRVVMELHGWGDPARRKYPLHILWLMTRHGFASARIGTSHSYDFMPAGKWRCALSLLRGELAFLPKHVVDRTGLRPTVYRVLTAPVLRKMWPRLAERARYRFAELKGEVPRTGGLGYNA